MTKPKKKNNGDRRLIEDYLHIEAISAEARREKSNPKEQTKPTRYMLDSIGNKEADFGTP